MQSTDYSKQEYFYHYAPMLLQEGAILLPGNFGRICKLGSGLSTREHFVEEIRQDYYPDKPSRLQCLFVLPTLHDAKLYTRHQTLVNNHVEWNLLYKVKLTQPLTNYHLGCTGIFDKMLANLSPTERDIAIAKDYWDGVTAVLQYSNGTKENFAREILVPHAIQIIERVL